MIGFGIILVSAVFHQFETMVVASYGRKYQKGGMFFNAIICLFAAIYFVISDTDGLNFAKEIWLYGIINSTIYALGFYSMYLSLKNGSYGLTNLATSFIVVITTLYGVIFLKEPANVFTYFSLMLVLISIILTKAKKGEQSEKTHISIKWIFYIALVIISNSLITIIGRLQFNAFGNTYKNEFSVISLVGATIFLFVLGFCLESDDFRSTFKNGFLYGGAAGILNGMKNLLYLIAYNYFSLSTSAPLDSGVKLVLGFAVSMLIYKEKFTLRQIVGVILGMMAVILMSI